MPYFHLSKIFPSNNFNLKRYSALWSYLEPNIWNNRIHFLGFASNSGEPKSALIRHSTKDLLICISGKKRNSTRLHKVNLYYLTLFFSLFEFSVEIFPGTEAWHWVSNPYLIEARLKNSESMLESGSWHIKSCFSASKIPKISDPTVFKIFGLDEQWFSASQQEKFIETQLEQTLTPSRVTPWSLAQ